MVIYFIRHGAVENPLGLQYGRLPGFPLSKSGRGEAVSIETFLSDKKLECLYASPLLRTRQTAEIIVEKIKIPLFFDDRLLEFDHGCYEGVKIEDYKTKALWQFGGETLDQAGKRVIAFLEEIKKENHYHVLGIVSHEAPIVMAILILQGKTEANYSSIPFPTGGCLKIDY